MRTGQQTVLVGFLSFVKLSIGDSKGSRGAGEAL
jgi:hypothetical protein